MTEDKHLVSIAVPEAKELLEDFPFAAEFWIGVIEYGVSGAEELAPLVWDGHLEHFEVFVLLLFGIGRLWY